MKTTSALLTVLMCVFVAFEACTQTMNDVIDAPGDIAFVGYEHDQSSGYAFVFIDNCPPGTVIIIDDEEWGGLPTGWNSTSGEGANTWTNDTGSMIPKGTVIKVENGNNNPTATFGSVIESDSGFNLGSMDAIFAYIGTFRTTSVTFLAMVGDTDDPSPQTLDDTGLVLGLHTFEIDDIIGDDEGIYTGSTMCNGTALECLQMINNSANWSGIGGVVSFPASVPDIFNGSVLPVRLTRFDAHLTGAVVNLQWETATEDNNDYFLVQRSSDGLHFEEVARVVSYGDTQTGHTYTAEDELRNSGTYYYRLDQVDLDGRISPLQTTAIRFTPDDFRVDVGPNPFDNMLQLSFGGSSTLGGVLTIHDAEGRSMVSRKMEAEVQNATINTESWNRGIYMVRYVSGAQNTVLSVIKSH